MPPRILLLWACSAVYTVVSQTSSNQRSNLQIDTVYILQGVRTHTHVHWNYNPSDIT